MYLLWTLTVRHTLLFIGSYWSIFLKWLSLQYLCDDWSHLERLLCASSSSPSCAISNKELTIQENRHIDYLAPRGHMMSIIDHGDVIHCHCSQLCNWSISCFFIWDLSRCMWSCRIDFFLFVPLDRGILIPFFASRYRFWLVGIGRYSVPIAKKKKKNHTTLALLWYEYHCGKEWLRLNPL